MRALSWSFLVALFTSMVLCSRPQEDSEEHVLARKVWHPAAETHESPSATVDATEHHQDKPDPEGKLEKLESYVASKGLLLKHIEAVEEKVVAATEAARKWKDSKEGVAEAAKDLEEASQRAAKIQQEKLEALVKENPKTAQDAVVTAA
eukprot:TRINITY_DN50244_c0_g1_i1.p1 TRINITY_DN50244_c0_g1~~TRINITY_DN50244_c0_g1_i1.p1  ORF type:complete len:149 (+),score=48.87 TRINITY_DN50244_c0_g1_i1:103-549(+)